VHGALTLSTHDAHAKLDMVAMKLFLLLCCLYAYFIDWVSKRTDRGHQVLSLKNKRMDKNGEMTLYSPAILNFIPGLSSELQN